MYWSHISSVWDYFKLYTCKKTTMCTCTMYIVDNRHQTYPGQCGESVIASQRSNSLLITERKENRQWRMHESNCWLYGRLAECDTLNGRLELNMVEGEVVIFQVPCCWSQHKCRLKLAPTCVSPKVYCAHSASDDNTHGAAAEAQSVRLVPQVVQWVYVASCST